MTVLETKRLYLKPFTSQDAENLYALNTNLEVIKYTGDAPFKNIEEAQAFIKNYITTVYHKAHTTTQTGLGRYAVTRKSDNIFLGWCFNLCSSCSCSE